MNVTDEQLIQQIAAGDSAAFAAFYDRHADRVFAVLTKMLGTRVDAEDALQEAFWQVWSRSGTYSATRGSPFFWLIMMARSRAIDIHRRRKPVSNGVATDSRATPSCDEVVEGREATQRIGAALHALPEEQRAVIRQSFFAGLSHEQIAAQQALPLGTVKTRIRLGMRRLRELLSEDRKVLAS